MPLEKELSESVTELKNPERKINVITAIVIASVLWASLTTVVGILYKNMRDDSISKSHTIYKMQDKIDSLNNLRYLDVKSQVSQERQIIEFREYQDSMNQQLLKIKNQLISK